MPAGLWPAGTIPRGVGKPRSRGYALEFKRKAPEQNWCFTPTRKKRPIAPE